jgi:N-acetylmuramic acid 6-phosphate etherase
MIPKTPNRKKMKTGTEAVSEYDNLETMSVAALINGINREDQSVALSVRKALPQIEKLIIALLQRMKEGGRLFYIGAGTSGRLGILDASECPPTYGVSPDLVVGLIAGGDRAIRNAVEFAEDNREQAWKDLQACGITANDSLIGIAASGQTPYTAGGLQMARQNGILTGCIVCNAGSLIAQESEFPVEVVTGPEFVTGSTRMKAGTAQKMVLNMISTTLMIQLGKVKGNLMVDMKLSNAKLWDRGINMMVKEINISPVQARHLLLQHGSVRKAINAWRKKGG